MVVMWVETLVVLKVDKLVDLMVSLKADSRGFLMVVVMELKLVVM